MLQRVKRGIVAALTATRQLFITSNNDSFTWEAFLPEVQRSSAALDEDTLRLGLLYLTDLAVLQSYQMNEEGTAVTRFSIGERIVKVRNPQEWLEHELARYCRKAEMVEAVGSEALVPEDDSAQVAEGDVLEMTSHAGFDWGLLHPEIRNVAFTRFRAGHFADSVEAALKAVNERVRGLYKRLRGVERDGAALMKEAFSPKHPALKLGDLDTATGRDMQLGYMEIFAGAMTGIRNPKAHGIIQIDAVRATHFLFVASLLMHKIDEAEAVQGTGERMPTGRGATEYATTPKIAAAPVASSDWKDLADRFGRLSRHVHANWTQWGGDSGRQLWSLGGSTAEETHQCRALCELAGAMLAKSPNLCRDFNDLHEPDAADRWLCFLKHMGHLQSNGYGMETLDDGTSRPIFLGMINNLAAVSATACLTCSANVL